MAERKRTLRDWWFDGLKLVVSVVVSTVAAVVTATWTVRGMLDEHDKRLTVLESVTAEIRANYIPRQVHEEHWKSDEQWRRQTDTQLQEQRQDIKEILRNVKR